LDRFYVFLGGQKISSEAAMGGEGGRAAPRLGVAMSSKRRARTRGQNPTSSIKDWVLNFLLVLNLGYSVFSVWKIFVSKNSQFITCFNNFK
jgi:hypothetical protein